MLTPSILNKLPDRAAVALRLAQACKRTLAVRLPPQAAPLHEGSIVRDRRSRWVRCNFRTVLSATMPLEEETTGHLGEWIVFWRVECPKT